MAPTGVACQARLKWLMTPLAASPASFQPSKAAMITGEVSLPMPSSSIAHHLLPRYLAAGTAPFHTTAHASSLGTLARPSRSATLSGTVILAIGPVELRGCLVVFRGS